MTENTDKPDHSTGLNDDSTDRDDSAHDDAADDLSSKLDPDFIPQQQAPPEEKRAREHPEETGS
jgi:hypothetical protein